MSNFQLNAGDSVVVTVTDTDTVTGAAVPTDAGSVTVVLGSSTDTVVANSDGTYTVTAGTTLGTSNSVTVNATVGGVASSSVVAYYDVVADVVTVNPTSLSVSFGTESAPAGTSGTSGPGPLDAAQVAALVAAGVPSTGAPLTATQLAALVAAGLADPLNPATGLPFPVGYVYVDPKI
jgi:hypothetical protein